MFDTHNPNSSDFYIRPVFSFRDKVRRLLWNISWAIFCKWTPNPLHAWRIWVLRKFGAKLGEQNFIYPTCKIWAPWLLKTEDVVTIGPGVEIYNPGGVYLKHHSILSQDAYLCGATHNYNSIEFTYIKKEIMLEPYVWICAKAIVLPGVHCGEGSVLGAGTITSKDLLPWMVYAGNPAKPVRERHNFLESGILQK
ncbi:putative colanic acid biosynthesis acetyltransferase [Spirosoma sp. KCTC 42546]|uniref:putative colanic acid biosynthesis acetyltransferase n=1 Tax=Spirosoma sp. KCTC 42546 TaxID=2520506 RepID=UPI00115C3D48|nr:putative colanic acid biosynthesis acetyltransferase [Spirosoma sp. KCTC 42546]QDK78668.1 putative colanic acid biosynthesis acetyltransferase [Spirosoma sp. KCTC 42546]